RTLDKCRSSRRTELSLNERRRRTDLRPMSDTQLTTSNGSVDFARMGAAGTLKFADPNFAFPQKSTNVASETVGVPQPPFEITISRRVDSTIPSKLPQRSNFRATTEPGDRLSRSNLTATREQLVRDRTVRNTVAFEGAVSVLGQVGLLIPIQDRHNHRPFWRRYSWFESMRGSHST